MLLIMVTKETAPKAFACFFIHRGWEQRTLIFLHILLPAFGLPALFCVNISEIQKPRDTIRQFFAALITWAFGYGAMWLGKFAIGSIITGENLFGRSHDACELLDGG